jgi:hypothetical protein
MHTMIEILRKKEPQIERTIEGVLEPTLAAIITLYGRPRIVVVRSGDLLVERIT